MDITIVTPSFNQGRFLRHTLESVLSQAGDFTLDYIVMDGGSTDDSLDVIRRYDHLLRSGAWKVRCRELRFRWFSERDRGQSHAVNKGFALAQGEILGWLNSDDVYHSDRTLDKIVHHFRHAPQSSFVYGRGYRMNEHGTREKEEWYITAFGIDDLLEVDYILQPAAFWRKRLFDLAGPLDESMHYAFDWDFWIRCSRHATLDFVDEFLACNRVYSETKTNCGGIPRKAEIARLLLSNGGFTQRSINAYLAEYDAPQVAPTVKRRRSFGQRLRALPHAVGRLSQTVGSAWEHRKLILRFFLTPTRVLERSLRRLLRGRPHLGAAGPLDASKSLRRAA